MTYFDLIKKYKNNELSEEQRLEIERDIERHEAISEYLFDREENENTDSFNMNIEPDDKDFVKKVDDSIRKAFVKVGITVGVITLALALAIIFVLPRAVSVFYYNPAEMVGEDTNRMSRDMAVYTELFMPGYFRDNVIADSEGYGKYDVQIIQNVSYTREFYNVSGKLTRGELKLYDINMFKKMSDNIFGWFQMWTDGTDKLSDLVQQDKDKNMDRMFFAAAGDREQATETLLGLDENEKYVAFVTLNELMPYEDFVAFLDSKDYVYGAWCAPCVNEYSDNRMFRPGNIGFNCQTGSSTSIEWDNEKYPELFVWDNGVFEEGRYDEMQENIKNEEYMTTHFVSLLNYMADQDKFLKMMDLDAEAMLSAAEYVNKNGLTIYGFACVGEKANLLKLNDCPEVYSIYTQKLK